MKKVLIISYYFPPRPDIGGLRVHGLAKYLPEFGWEPIILTPNQSGMDKEFNFILTPHIEILDILKRTLRVDHIAEIKPKLKLSNENKNYFSKIIFSIIDIIFFPDYFFIGWYFFALNNYTDFSKTQSVDAIISTSPPPTCHILANRIKAVKKVPWIADLRDPWLRSYAKVSFLRKYMDLHAESIILRTANAIVSVSEPISANLTSKFKGKNVKVIKNGFDFDDYDIKNISLTDKFTLTYTGNLYGGLRDPSNLFQAVSELISDNFIKPDDIEIRFYGSDVSCISKLVNQFNANKWVILNPPLPRAQVIKKQMESQILLNILANNPNEYGVYTGKIFEYIGARRPILSIGPASVIKELLESTKAGIHLSNVAEIKYVMKQLYDEYKTDGYIEYKGNQSILSQFSQKEMAKHFANCLNEAIGE